MADYKLTYFDGRGRVEVIRYIFAVAGVDYEDIRFKDLPEWFAKKTGKVFIKRQKEVALSYLNIERHMMLVAQLLYFFFRI